METFPYRAPSLGLLRITSLLAVGVIAFAALAIQVNHDVWLGHGIHLSIEQARLFFVFWAILLGAFGIWSGIAFRQVSRARSVIEADETGLRIDEPHGRGKRVRLDFSQITNAALTGGGQFIKLTIDGRLLIIQGGMLARQDFARLKQIVFVRCPSKASSG